VSKSADFGHIAGVQIVPKSADFGHNASVQMRVESADFALDIASVDIFSSCL